MKAGIFEISETAYHADEIGDEITVSSSVLNTLLERSPLHAREQHPRLAAHYRPREDAAHFDVGKAVHKMVLEGEDIVEVLDFPDYRTKAAKFERDAAREMGKIPLLGNDADAVMAMYEAAKAQLPVSIGLATDDVELTIIWQEDNGVWCRARPDWRRDGLMADLKTAASAHPDAFNRQIWANGYAIQAAFYMRGLRAVVGKVHKHIDWQWWVLDKTYPHAMSVVTLTPQSWDLANRQVEHALHVWARCLEQDNWPGYPKQIVEVEAPPYIEARFEDMTARHEAPA